MYTYDPTTRILKIQQIPEKDIDMAMVQYQRESYKKFCEVTVFDILEGFVQEVGKTINHNVSIVPAENILPERQLPKGFYADHKPSSKWSTEIRTLPDRYTPIMVRLDIDGAKHTAEIFRLPDMNEDAVLNVHGERRIVQTQLVAADGVSFDGNAIDGSIGISTPMRNFTIKLRKSGGAGIKYSGSMVDLYDVLALYCAKEGVDINFMELYTSAAIRSWIAPKSMTAFQAIASKLAAKKIYETYHTSVYHLGKTARESLNRAMSLNRAKGRELSRDILGTDGVVVAHKGATVTDAILKECYKHRVHVIYVTAMPDVAGYKLKCSAGFTKLDIIPLGTVIPDIVRQCLPAHMRNMGSTSKTLFFHGPGADLSIYGDDPLEVHLVEYPPTIPADLNLNDDIIQLLGDCGYDTLTVGRSADNWFDVTYEEAIVGNMTAQLKDVMPISEIISSGRHADAWVCYADNPNFEYREEVEDYLNVWDFIGLVGLVGYIRQHPDRHGLIDKDEGMLKHVLGPNELFARTLLNVIPDVCKKMKSSWTRSANDNSRLMDISLDALGIEWQKRLWANNIIQAASFQNPTLHMQQANVINTAAGLKEVPNAMRMLATGFYGRIDPYETPMGKSIGITNVRALGSRIDVDSGIIYTAYLPVIKDGSDVYVKTDAEPTWLSAQDEVLYRIGDKLSLDWRADGEHFNNTHVVARVPDGKGGHAIETIMSHTLDFVNWHSCQHISLSTALIPFVGADEAARLTLGTGMIKQSILVQHNEKPRIFTSVYRQMFGHTKTYCAYAEEDGFVVSIGSDGVTIQKPRPESKIPAGVDFVGDELDMVDLLGECDGMPFHTYAIDPTLITRQGLNIINWRVREGQWVRKGDILYDSSIALDGVYSPGCNFLVSYIPNGYNYEDAVEVSESAAQRFTSITLETVPIHLGVDSDTAPRFFPNTRTYIPENGELAVFYLKERRGHVIKKSVTSGIHSGVLLDVIHDRTEHRGYTEYLAHLVAFNRLRVGDKLIGRHSNKGTSSIVRKNSEMPRFQNGIPIDINLNPLGVPSRLNVGQNFEAWLGFCAYLLDIYIESDSFNGATKGDVAELMSFCYDVCNTSNPRSAVAKYPNIPIGLRNQAIERYSSMCIWAGCFNRDGTANLINPRSGKTYPVPVTFGMPYMLKLEHEVNRKIKARAGLLDNEEYSAIWQQPVEGVARGGGERIGEMEMTAYAAYGANELLRETLNEDSDNVTERFLSAAQDAGRLSQVKLTNSSLYFNRATAVPHSLEYFRYLLEVLGINFSAPGLPPCDIETSERRALPDRRTLFHDISEDAYDESTYDMFEEGS